MNTYLADGWVGEYAQHEDEFFTTPIPQHIAALPMHDGWGINPWTGKKERWPEKSRIEREKEMGRFAKENGSKFQEVAPDTYAARFLKVVDLGTSVPKFSTDGKKKTRLMLSWELDHKMDDGRPFTISAFVSNSLSEKATLRKWLEQVRGRPFTREELAGFDLSKVIGVPCLLTVSTGEKSGKSYVSAVTKLPKQMPQPPELHNEPVTFFLDEFDQQAFDSLSDGIKANIMESDEYKAMNAKADPSRHFDDMQDDVPSAEDVPF